jgi:hypothetical protein
MTEDEMKKIASMTLTNASILGRLASSFVILTEKVLPLINDDEKQSVIGLLHELEQLEAVTSALQPDLERARKELGLE